MTGFLEAIAMLGAIFGGVAVVIAAIGPGLAAPQQAALAAIGIGLGAIPYFWAALAHHSDMRRLARRADKRAEVEVDPATPDPTEIETDLAETRRSDIHRDPYGR